MRVNSIDSQKQSRQNFGRLKVDNPSEWKRCIKETFGKDKKGYKRYIDLFNSIARKHVKDPSYDILLFANEGSKKGTFNFEAMIMYKRLNTMANWIRSIEAPYKNLSSKKVVTRILTDADKICPQESFSKVA